jgi:hypothetical protein
VVNEIGVERTFSSTVNTSLVSWSQCHIRKLLPWLISEGLKLFTQFGWKAWSWTFILKYAQCVPVNVFLSSSAQGKSGETQRCSYQHYNMSTVELVEAVISIDEQLVLDAENAF